MHDHDGRLAGVALAGRDATRDWDDDSAGKCLSTSRFHLVLVAFREEESHRARCRFSSLAAHCRPVDEWNIFPSSESVHNELPAPS